MLADHLKSAVTRERLRSGPAVDHIDGFAGLDKSSRVQTDHDRYDASFACQLDGLDASGWVHGTGLSQGVPLPQDVGDALLHYLRQSRPTFRTPEVFTTVLAPVRPLTRATVTHIVRAALRRARIKAPVNGAHVLRHSAATTMLRHGASLAGIRAVLRHRSPGTTALYAKVDFGLLSEIAQSWPAVPSC